jgi:DNA primase
MEKPSHRSLLAEDLSVIREDAGRRWRDLFRALGLVPDQRKSKDADWWAHSPLPGPDGDRSPSFHMEEGGRWYCFSTRRGGGPIELVRDVFGLADSYEAGRKLIELGFGPDAAPATATSEVAPTPPAIENRVEKKKKTINKPIRQDLTPLLDPGHAMLRDRGISEEAARAFGAGFLDPDESKSRLAGRLVFQVRGFREADGRFERTVLSHLGRAATREQEVTDGKYLAYAGFRKTLELLGQDRLVLDQATMLATITAGRIIIVEGPFDYLKLHEAGVLNVASSLGAFLSTEQIGRINTICQILDIPPKVLVWYDRDEAGSESQERALDSLGEAGIEGEGFVWSRTFASDRRGDVGFPDAINDPCDFSAEQLRWLREEPVI